MRIIFEGTQTTDWTSNSISHGGTTKLFSTMATLYGIPQLNSKKRAKGKVSPDSFFPPCGLGTRPPT